MTGWKASHLQLAFDDDGAADVVFSSLSHSAPHAARADARCLEGLDHDLEAMAGCTCGFHAYADEASARGHAQVTFMSALLEVVGSGLVIEHERGYRFSTQRVKRVNVRACAWCHRRPAQAFVVREEAPFDAWDGVRTLRDALVPRCGAHLFESTYGDGQPTRALGHLCFDEVASLLTRQASAPVEVVSRADALDRKTLDATRPEGFPSARLTGAVWA